MTVARGRDTVWVSMEPHRSEARRAPSRVQLRLPRAEDEAAFVALRRASRAHLEPWEPDPPDGHDPWGADEFARLLAGRASPRRRRWLVCARSDASLLGVCALSAITRGVLQSAVVSYWIGAAHARRGFMSEALGLVIDEAFGPLELHRLEALVLPENEASRRLLGRVGFHCEGISQSLVRFHGTWRDHERWALIRDAEH